MSDSLVDPGNVKPRRPKRCPKGKVRRKGRCVKKHRHHHRHSKQRAGHNQGGKK